MPVQITIIGLGQIGASIGLALGKHGTLLHRVGHDKSVPVARGAEKMGAVDAVKTNLPASVREAKIVMLCLPLQEVRDTLGYIAEDLQEGAVVLDTCPIKAPVAGWVREFLPQGRYHVGLVPAINPAYLHRTETGLEAARADLFEGGTVALDALPGTPEEAVRLASDLVTLLGAAPLFAGMVESDGLMAGAHLAPQLLAAALLRALVGEPGWDDARKLAGRPFAAFSSALAYQDEMAALGAASTLNAEGVTRVLDRIIAGLREMRDEIASGQREALEARLERALEGRERWLSERTRAEWSRRGDDGLDELPTLAERLFGSRKHLKKK